MKPDFPPCRCSQGNLEGSGDGRSPGRGGPRPRPSPEQDGEALRLAAHPAFDQLAGLGEDAELAFLLADVHANMVHGSPRVENATAVIWKTLLIAEQTFRRLDAPELLAEVAEGVVYVNGVRVQRTEDTAKKKAAA